MNEKTYECLLLYACMVLGESHCCLLWSCRVPLLSLSSRNVRVVALPGNLIRSFHSFLHRRGWCMSH